MMKPIYMLGILLLLVYTMKTVDGTTTWSQDIYWHPSASDSWYNFVENKTNVDHIYMDSLRFTVSSEVVGQADINFSIWDNANITLNAWNATWINITNTVIINMTVCGLDTGVLYSVSQSGVGIWNNLIGPCITFNLSSADDTIILGGESSFTEVEYAAFNGSGYETGYNQSIQFWCLPLHNNCTPLYQNDTQWTFNYTNSGGTDTTLYIKLNESIRGYTIRAYNESNTTASSNVTTTRLSMGSVASLAMKKIWFWIDTFYPYTDWNSTIIMEVG